VADRAAFAFDLGCLLQGERCGAMIELRARIRIRKAGFAHAAAGPGAKLSSVNIGVTVGALSNF
jgi:hypothetical protein